MADDEAAAGEGDGAHIDVFWTLAIIVVLMIAAAAALRPIDLSAPARGH